MKNELMSMGQGPLTMSSLDLLALINRFRLEFGETEVRRNDFHSRVRDELDGEHYEIFVVPNGNGTVSEAFKLTLKQCTYVAMRESKGVRRQVQQALEAGQAQAKAPAELTRMDILQIAMQAEQERLIAVAQRDEAIRTKAEISRKREATAMATASAKSKEVAKLQYELGRNQQHATVIAVEKATKQKFAKNAYVALRKAAKEFGLVAVDVVDQRYGSVKAWPAAAWRKCFGIELSELFPSKGMA